jgi:hypothetical protein
MVLSGRGEIDGLWAYQPRKETAMRKKKLELTIVYTDRTAIGGDAVERLRVRLEVARSDERSLER